MWKLWGRKVLSNIAAYRLNSFISLFVIKHKNIKPMSIPVQHIKSYCTTYTLPISSVFLDYSGMPGLTVFFTHQYCPETVWRCFFLLVDHERRYHIPLQWRHNERDGVCDHQPLDCLLSRLFGRKSKKTSKLRVTGLCVGNSPGTGEFPAQMASNAEMFPFVDVTTQCMPTYLDRLHWLDYIFEIRRNP